MISDTLVSQMLVHQANGIWFWEKRRIIDQLCNSGMVSPKHINWDSVKSEIAKHMQREHNLSHAQENEIFSLLKELS